MEDTIYNFATNLDPFTQYWWKVKAIDDTTAVWSGLWSFTTGSATEFAGGSGTEADPYLVATAANLNNVRNYPGAHFLQMADIDLGVAPWNEGEGWVPIGNASAAFSGTYNGNSFAITGLYQNRPTEDYQGLFGFTFYGLITGVSMQFANISGGNWCGAVIGRANSTTITNCISSGVVNGTGGSIGGLIGRMDSATLNQSNSSVYVNGDGYSVGGLVGRCDSSIITDCSCENGFVSGTGVLGGLIGYIVSNSSISRCYSTGTVNPSSDYAGGFAGAALNSTIADCYSMGQVFSNEQNYVGGFIGEVDGSTVNRCYSIGQVAGIASTAGGFAGSIINDSTWDYCYWNTESSTQTTSACGEGRTTAEMTYPFAANTYVG